MFEALDVPQQLDSVWIFWPNHWSYYVYIYIWIFLSIGATMYIYIYSWILLNHWLADEKWILSLKKAPSSLWTWKRVSADSSGMIWLSWQLSSNALLAQGGASTQQSFEIQYVYQLNQLWLFISITSPWYVYNLSPPRRTLSIAFVLLFSVLYMIAGFSTVAIGPRWNEPAATCWKASNWWPEIKCWS